MPSTAASCRNWHRATIFAVSCRCCAMLYAALAAGSTAQVDAVHAKALALGAQDEGPAGPGGSGFYAAYFRDLDGNKLNCFHFG